MDRPTHTSGRLLLGGMAWGAPEGRRIPLRLIVLRATGAAPAGDPAYLLTGGPGQAATERVVEFAKESARTRVQRDLVLVDQRRTGGSNPLRCETPQEDDPEEILRQRARTCLERHAASADVRLYTTPHAGLHPVELDTLVGCVEAHTGRAELTSHERAECPPP